MFAPPTPKTTTKGASATVPSRSRAGPGARWSGTPLFLQRKALEVDSEASPLEREADAVAKRIMRMPDGAASAAAVGGADGDRGEPGAGGESGRASSAPSPGPAVHVALGHGGSPLAGAERAYFEPRLGADLSGVRVHTGPAAHSAASEIGAKAFTHSQNIYFGAGRYAPGTGEGRRLLAHELAHTLQQGGGGRDLIQADFESDFAGRSAVRVADSPVAPPGTIRITNANGEAVWAPYAIYPPGEVPQRYQDQIMESGKAFQWRNPDLPPAQAAAIEKARGANAGELTVGDMTRLAEGHGRKMNIRVMIVRIGNDYRFVGYDMSETTRSGVVREGFVEAERGTAGVGRALFVDRTMRALQSGAPAMALQVHDTTDERTPDFHTRIYEVTGRKGQPRLGEHYRLTPREMIRVALAWSEELSAAQRSQLTALAAGRQEPAPIDVQRVLKGTPTPGRGGGAPPAAPPAPGGR
ncbi:MAG TPA: DUF4157 domain-containing protein, partial [Geminicoccaceae bacterium]|nr:DUF4157 domain-containing protein [Geminicoccaceae bacterium]